MATKKLTSAEKAFIVQCVACFDTPSVVVETVKKEFGKTISRQLVEAHDPTKKAGQNLGKAWKELFETTRKTFIDDTSEIAISHRPVRLRALQRMADKAETQGNMVLAASLLEQAAKEVGEAYTNTRKLEHSGRGGGPIPVVTKTTSAKEAADAYKDSLDAGGS